jgi:HK97 gp10 family phage protein
MIEMKLSGAKELEAALHELPNSIAKNVLTRAMKEAAQPIADDAASRVAVGIGKHKGRLKRRIAVSSKLSKRQRRQSPKSKNEATIYVGVATVTEAITEEYGTGPRYEKRGKYDGQVPASPFLRPAWEGGKVSYISTLGASLWKKIDAAAKRLARRRAKGK